MISGLERLIRDVRGPMWGLRGLSKVFETLFEASGGTDAWMDRWTDAWKLEKTPFVESLVIGPSGAGSTFARGPHLKN